MAKQNQRQQVRQEARQAAQSGNFSQANVQAMRQAGVQPQTIQNIRSAAQAAPSKPSNGMNIGYGVTNTGTPGGNSMPGGTDAQGRPIPASQASNIFKLNIPFSTQGVTNMWGNPMNNFDTGFQVVGDGVDWQDPKNAALLAQYTSPEAVNRQLNTAWAMSSLNPNREKNMAAFIDSGHAESLLTGLPPSAMPAGYTGLFNPSMTGTITPWSQQYAAANSGGNQASTSTPPGTSSQSNTGQTAAAQQTAINKKSSLSKNLKIAQAGGITRNELADLSKGIDGGRVIRRMDAMNKKGNDLRLNAGAANMLLKQAGPAYGGFYSLNQKPTFGTGNIGRALESMRGTRPSGGYTNPQSGYSMKTPGTEPTLMMGGTQIRKGGRPAVIKQGGQTAAPITTNPTTTSDTPSTTPGPVGAATDGPLDQLQKDNAAVGPGGLYGGGLGSAGASSLRRARSRQQQLGIRGAGTSLMNRTSPFFNALNR
jgi:hypothetical protein